MHTVRRKLSVTEMHVQTDVHRAVHRGAVS
ncbi:hypothetical protein SAMN04489716_5916 [Actinoplanes derwentensis]|uniref:Uncharacterized protein n=1 Tax=Actinoplanes derwentensis TaxID=113562 RepID=A0A1H2CIU5_9ACTN|nr:hypothetical protein SAMN04489716_5916 [Actinoplanes derwentensis]